MIRNKEKILFTAPFRRYGFLACLWLVALALIALPFAHRVQAAHPAKPTINIGTKNFDEEYVISAMYGLLLQEAGFSTKIHDLGQTPILQTALLKGDIDMYPEYTGTGVQVVLKHTQPIANAKKAYNFVKKGYRKFHLTWLDQSPMNDTNAVAVTKAFASKNHLKTLSDLAKIASNVKFAALSDCKDRPDCLGGLQNVYGMHFKDIVYVDSTTLTLQALQSGQVDAAEVFGTDGRIKKFNLVSLKDDKVIFPADHIAPVVRDSVLHKYSKIAPALNRLAPYLTNKAVIKMNVQYDIQHMKATDIARGFLKSKHLL